MNRAVAFGLGVAVGGLTFAVFTVGFTRMPVAPPWEPWPPDSADSTATPRGRTEMRRMMSEMMGAGPEDNCAQMMDGQAGQRV